MVRHPNWFSILFRLPVYWLAGGIVGFLLTHFTFGFDPEIAGFVGGRIIILEIFVVSGIFLATIWWLLDIRHAYRILNRPPSPPREPLPKTPPAPHEERLARFLDQGDRADESSDS